MHGLAVRPRRVGGQRGGGAGPVGHVAVVEALAPDLHSVDVRDRAVIGHEGHLHSADLGQILDREGRAPVEGDRARGGGARLEDSVQALPAVADGRGARRPGGVVVGGGGPRLVGRRVLPQVAPLRGVPHQGVARFGGGLGAVGGDLEHGGGGATGAGSAHSPHEETVLPAHGDARRSPPHGRHRAVVAQDLVGGRSGHGVPCERRLAVARARGRKVGGSGGRGLPRCEAREAAGPLVGGLGGEGTGEVAPHPQGSGVVDLQRPRPGRARGREAVGGPPELAASRAVPRPRPADLVRAGPAGAQLVVAVRVLEHEVRAVARGVDHAVPGAGHRLHVAAVLHGDRTGGPRHGGRVVAEERVLGAPEVHAPARQRHPLLVHPVEVRGLEGPRGVQGGARRSRHPRGVGGRAALRPGEVASRVEVTARLVDVESDDRAVELGIPRAVGLPGQGQAHRPARVRAAAPVVGGVGEQAAQVDVLAGDPCRLDGHRARAQRVAQLQRPRGVDGARGRVDDDRAHVLLAVDPREVADRQQARARQLDEVLDLVVEGEGLPVPLPRRRVEARQGGGLRLRRAHAGHAREVTAHIHGGADLLEGLDLGVALRVGAVEVARHTPLHRRRVLGDRRRDGLRRGSRVRDPGVGVVRAQLRAQVHLGVGLDGEPRLAEETGVGGVRVEQHARAVAEPHPVLRRGGRGHVDHAPRQVVAELGPDRFARRPLAAVDRVDDRVRGFEGPHEVRHLRQAHLDGLPGRPAPVVGAHDPHAVGQFGDGGGAEEAVDGFVRQLHGPVRGPALALGQRGGGALALAPGLPPVGAAPDEDPSAPVARLVAEEPSGRVHGGGLQPVGAVRRVGVVLLDLPARGGRARLGQAVADGCGRRGLRGHVPQPVEDDGRRGDHDEGDAVTVSHGTCGKVESDIAIFPRTGEALNRVLTTRLSAYSLCSALKRVTTA